MRYIFLTCLLFTLSFSEIIPLTSFAANFTQTITDEKGKVLTYSGSLQALKPQFALWKYSKPVEKEVYISDENIIIVEPEIEQVIIRQLKGNFDFFTIMKNAKEISKDHFVANFEESKLSITMKESKVSSLSYKDEFDNDVKIIFSQQIQNEEINPKVFQPSYPQDYDIIRD